MTTPDHNPCRACDGRGRIAVPTYHDDAGSLADRLEPGGQVFSIVDGQFSVIDLIAALADRMDAPDLSIMTWTAHREHIEHLVSIKEAGALGDVRFLFDRTIASQRIDVVARVVVSFGQESLRMSRLHTKIYMLRDDDWDVMVTSSANLNNNRRFEHYQISDWPEACDYVEEVFDTTFEHHDMRYMPSAETIEKARQAVIGNPSESTSSEGVVAPGFDREFNW